MVGCLRIHPPVRAVGLVVVVLTDDKIEVFQLCVGAEGEAS